ncbi:MAG: aldose 1-epimerase family protein [Clostridia bacterium]|nr:aldose 1-epimerase family protein [Clostridia bacterium]
MIILDNGHIKAEISERGAEIRSLTVDGEQRFWSGDPTFWAGVAPVLFPICGGLKDDKFTLDGEEFLLAKHGFAKNMDFKVEQCSNASAVFLLTETAETLKSYPWKFEFRIKYTLTGTAVKVEYDIKNCSDSVMYTSVGSHEAYACPEGIEDYDIIFERNETLNAAKVVGTLISRETETVLKDSKVLPLYNKYFDIDALVFTDLRSRYVTLRNRRNGKSVSVDFDGFDYLLLWTKPGAGYICIEPWTTIPSHTDDGYELSAKEGMTALAPQKHFERKHIIHF